MARPRRVKPRLAGKDPGVGAVRGDSSIALISAALAGRIDVRKEAERFEVEEVLARWPGGVLRLPRRARPGRMGRRAACRAGIRYSDLCRKR